MSKFHAPLLLMLCLSAPLCAQHTELPASSQASASLPSSAAPKLTLADAEKMALAQNPSVSIGRLLQLAQVESERNVRSAELPSAEGNVTAVDAHANSRLTAGALNNPIVYERAAAGLTVRQLITDFGRTHSLIQNADLLSRAQLETERATQDDIRLAVDQAFYQALSAQAVLEVAQRTVATRQATIEQISALASQNLRSTLDQSLAQVQLSQAKLLLLDGENAFNSALASLNALLGSEDNKRYELLDDAPNDPQPAPDNTEELVQVALNARPDLLAQYDRSLAAKQFARAEHDLSRPTISALAAVGGTPIRADQIQSNWYAAAGANLSIPLFNGFAYSARAKEADLRAQAAQERVRGLRDVIARDARMAVLDAQIAYRRINVSKQLLAQSNTALELAQARYKVGLSGIVDLTQSQLAQTQAAISYANAKYQYQTALAVVRYQTGQ